MNINDAPSRPTILFIISIDARVAIILSKGNYFVVPEHFSQLRK